MLKFLPFAIVAAMATLSACNSTKESVSSSANTLSKKEEKDGWKNLFDGKTTNGWHSYGRSTVGQAWQVVDGALYFDTTQRQGRRIIGRGDLTTNAEYENFHLKLEWKVPQGANSGIIFLVITNKIIERYF